jgi:hypothetical protein
VAERSDKSQMAGSFLREAAVLWFALYPLEAYINHNFDWTQLCFVYAGAFAALYLGMILEGTDEEGEDKWTSMFPD